jgi:hypothetical protein
VRRTPPQSRRPFLVALGASVTIHLIAIPLLMAGIKPTGGLAVAELAAVLPEDELTIGLEASEASTLDWIGYAEYQEHLAELSETNQAAFTETPSQPAQESIAEIPDVPLEMEEIAPAEETVTEVEPAEAPQPEATRQAEEQPTDVMEIAEAPVEETEPSAPAESAPSTPDLTPFIRAARDWLMASVLTQHLAGEATTPAADSSVDQPNNPGDLSEKESDPTSIIDVPQDQWMLGKPLAAKGLELFPQRASFTLLTRMTAVIRNPVAALEFDSRGIVVRASLLKSSGNSQVDINIIDSLYGWRAKGEELSALSEDETIPIEIRMLMVD